MEQRTYVHLEALVRARTWEAIAQIGFHGSGPKAQPTRNQAGNLARECTHVTIHLRDGAVENYDVVPGGALVEAPAGSEAQYDAHWWVPDTQLV